MNKIYLTIALLIFAYTNSIAQHNTKIHVSTSGVDSGSIGLLTNPFRNIQTAVNYSQNGDSILIASGTYLENIYVKDKKISLIGTSTNSTILDGSANGFPVIRLEGTPNQNSNRCSIKNLTLQNGKILSGEYGSILDIKVCNVPIVENCIIKNGKGGTASIYIYYCDSAHLKNVEVFNNNTKVRAFSSKVFIDNCKIRNNTVSDNISGFQIWRGVASINNSIFYKNRSGVEFLDNRRACVLEASEGARININNSTILQNLGPGSTSRGIHVQTDAKAFVRNSIIWGHDSSSLSLYEIKDSIDIDYSIVQNGLNGIKKFGPGSVIWGNHNLNLNPLIFDTINFELSNQSAAIGAANLFYSKNKDYNNNQRPNPVGSNPDIGALENYRGSPVDSSCAYAFVQEPSDLSVNRGNNASFTSNSIGIYNYQWQSNAASLGWMNIPNNYLYSGVNTRTININKSSYSNEAQLFRLVASKSNCADTSKVVRLTISNLINDSLNLIRTNDSLSKLFSLYVNKHDTIYINSKITTDTLVIGMRTGITENSIDVNSIKVFPNPTSSELYINPEKPTFIHAKLFNNLGQLIAETTLGKLDVLNTPSGIYLLGLFDGSGKQISTSKIYIKN